MCYDRKSLQKLIGMYWDLALSLAEPQSQYTDADGTDTSDCSIHGDSDTSS
jgi:hypothetical protein